MLRGGKLKEEPTKPERDMNNCKNFLNPNFCRPWIIKTFIAKDTTGGKPISYFNLNDIKKSNEICATCENFVS